MKRRTHEQLKTEALGILARRYPIRFSHLYYALDYSHDKTKLLVEELEREGKVKMYMEGRNRWVTLV